VSRPRRLAGKQAPLLRSVRAAIPNSSDGERRPVTVLFADLVDYTRMSRSLDPEDVHSMLERFYGSADEIVERFGGSIDKHIGDSVMAVFGAPVAHDDDAIRAVRAAAEIHRAMPSVRSATGEPLAVHVGIASGEVVASGLGGARHRAYTVIGNSVNLAARLLKLAGAGETVLDEAVHVTTQRIARCAPIADAKVKGIDAPLTAWRFVEFVDAGERSGAYPFRRSRGGARAARGHPRKLRRGRHRGHRVRAGRRRHRQIAPRRRIAQSRACRRVHLPYRARARLRHGQGPRGGP
jgi:class 3 adenylate cyclase